jgi:hypothetical protein
MEVVKVSETPPPPPLSSTQCSDTIGSINKVLVIMCNFSRYVVALPIEHENEETIANSLLEKWIIALATRSRLLSDRGASFLSTLNMRLYHNAATVQQDQHVGLHAKLQRPGRVERQNKTLIDIVAKYVNVNKPDWPAYLNTAVAVYNATVHATTLYSPYYLWHGRPYQYPMQVNLATDTPEYLSTQEFIQDRLRILHRAYEHSKHNELLQSRGQEPLLHRKQQGISFGVGDLVLHKVPDGSKLCRAWQGAFQVTRLNGPVASTWHTQVLAMQPTLQSTSNTSSWPSSGTLGFQARRSRRGESNLINPKSTIDTRTGLSQELSTSACTMASYNSEFNSKASADATIVGSSPET